MVFLFAQIAYSLDALDQKDRHSILGLRRGHPPKWPCRWPKFLRLARVGMPRPQSLPGEQSPFGVCRWAWFIWHANFAKWARRSWRLLAMWVEDSRARLAQKLGSSTGDMSPRALLENFSLPDDAMGGFGQAAC